MINLTAKGRDQELILAYLQENASDVLTDKINNGTPFEKDGKQLVNKKDLNGFMTYACEEARKLAEKGSRSACVEDAVVYGWAIHYFEEDSIQGKLYNQDGTEYKPPAPVKKATQKPATPPPKPKSQFSFFDMLNEQKEQEQEVELQADDHEVVDEEPTVEQIADNLQQAIDEKHNIKPKKHYPQFYTQYLEIKDCYPDSIILVRLGDFYEAFDSDAEILANELNLTLTSRKITDDERVPMVGFPYHAADIYFSKIRVRHSIAMIEFNGEIVMLQKTSAPVCKDDLIDMEEDIEELSETEMQQFDGDIQEPIDIPETEPMLDNNAYDETALTKILKLLGNDIIVR